jgi:serine/threonine-protein kinase
MDSERWVRLQALFHEAVARTGLERDAFLESVAADDAQLAASLRAMIDEDERGASLLDRGIAQAAERLVAREPAAPDFGPYRMQRVLGEGGMGVVYLASRDDLGIQVAIKLLRDAWMSPARRERFAHEQRLLAQLTHPSIARLYDAETLPDGAPCIVMEYVEGLPLTEYCDLHRKSLVDRLRLFRAVCEPVRYAHSRAVIHRDLKPSNILVQVDGAVKLLDFGIAKQLDRCPS